jgi:hypothetical protein
MLPAGYVQQYAASGESDGSSTAAGLTACWQLLMCGQDFSSSPYTFIVQFVRLRLRKHPPPARTGRRPMCRNRMSPR